MKNLRQIIEDWDNDDKHLVEHYKYNNEQKKHIKDFTGNSFEVNDYHWRKHEAKTYNMPEGSLISGLNKEKLDHHTKIMDSAMEHKTPHDMTVYSGVVNDPRPQKNKKGIVNHPAYLSTSLHKNVAEDFAETRGEGDEQHLLEIYVPQGSKGAYINHVSHFGGQKEFLLPRETNMKHIKSTMKKNQDVKHYYHKMKVVE